MASNSAYRQVRRAQDPQEVVEAIRAAARSQMPGALEGLISGYHPIDIAFAMRELAGEEREAVFRLLEARDAGVVLEEVDDEVSADLAEATEEAELAEIIDAMPPDAGSDVVKQLDQEKAHRVLDRIPDEESAELRELLQFGAETAGGIMTPEVLYAPPDLTAAQLIAHLRSQKLAPEVLTYVYIVDEDSRRLLGVLDMRELITTPPGQALGEVMVTDVVTVHPDTDREDVVRLVDKYDLMALPVVDEQERLCGVVTIDDVIDAIQEEHTEDIFLVFGGVHVAAQDVAGFEKQAFQVGERELLFFHGGWIQVLLFTYGALMRNVRGHTVRSQEVNYEMTIMPGRKV